MANQKLQQLVVPGGTDIYDIDAKYIKGYAPDTYVHNNMKEAYLTWGGKHFSGSYGPIDAAMIQELGPNRLAFAGIAGITLEYSLDGIGWSTLSNDTLKKQLFSTNGSFYIGNSSSTFTDKSNYQCRITLRTSSGYGNIYTVLNKFAIYVSTGGSTGCWCTIQGRTEADRAAGTSTWTTFANKVSISGWSGWNIINTTSITTHGNSDSHYAELRFIFGVSSHSALSLYQGLAIQRIMGFGGVGWTTPSNMAKNGHMYSYDYDQNVTFPGNVYVASGKKFIGDLQGNADTATKVATTYATADDTAYELLAAPKNSDAHDSVYKNANIKIIPLAESFQDPASGKIFDSGPKVLIGSNTLSNCWTDYTDGGGSWEFDSWSTAGTGHLEVTGNLIVGGGSDEYGIFPAQHNYSTIGDPDHYWYQIYANQFYEGGSLLSNKYQAKGTANSTNSTSKLYLVGATTQNASGATYSNSKCYASGGYLYSNGSKVLTSQTTAYNYIGAADTASNAETTNGSTYLKLYEGGTKRSQFKIEGSGATTVSSATNGDITINSTDRYHTTGSWSGLTYTATANGGAGALAFTIPTGTTSTTVATGNHTHTASLATDTGTSAITLAHGSKYKLTAGGSSVIFTMPASGNTDYKASSYNTSSKIFLIGATSQGSSTSTGMTTYSHDTAYVGTDGCLYSNSTKVSTEGHTHSYLPLSGGTMTGNITFNQNAAIRFTNTDSSGTDYTDYSMIQFFSGDANGCGILIGGGGYVGIGSGESATAVKNALSAAGGTEELHLSSDGPIYLHSNCQTVANRKTITIDNTGNVSAVSFTATSDRRLKENIESYVCDKNILDLDVKKFDFINGAKNQIGCIAQDLQEICPELVNEGEDGYLSIHESKLVYLLLQELKKQNKRINDLESMLNKE